MQYSIIPTNTSTVINIEAIIGAVLTGAIGPLIVYKFTVNSSLALLDSFPEQRVSEFILGKGNGTLFSRVASWMEDRIDAAAVAGDDIFDGIVAGVRAVLDALTLALNGSPLAPLGIWFGKSSRAYKIAEPVLDLMQTLPAFVF